MQEVGSHYGNALPQLKLIFFFNLKQSINLKMHKYYPLARAGRSGRWDGREVSRRTLNATK